MGATRHFCDAESRDDVQRFFTEHKVVSAERALGQSVERINLCIAYKNRQQKNFSAWLGKRQLATGN